MTIEHFINNLSDDTITEILDSDYPLIFFEKYISITFDQSYEWLLVHDFEQYHYARLVKEDWKYLLTMDEFKSIINN